MLLVFLSEVYHKQVSFDAVFFFDKNYNFTLSGLGDRCINQWVAPIVKRIYPRWENEASFQIERGRKDPNSDNLTQGFLSS